MEERSVVIVGAGLAAAKTAESLRQEGFGGSITVLGEESVPPYERPVLSKDYLLRKAELQSAFVFDEQWYRDQDVEVQLGTRVTQLDVPAHAVSLQDGAGITYTDLVLATGARPRPLPVPGADLPGVHYLRTMDDAKALRDALGAVERIAVVGGGWIGLEVAGAARASGVDVTVLEQADQPLGAVLGPQVAPFFAQLHRDHGVDVRTNVAVESFLLGEQGVAGVWLGDGQQLHVDAVVVGVGITPNTELAAEAGLPVDNGILVDEHLRSSDPNIYAVGDVANAWHPGLGRRIRVEHWANAINQPRVAALGILGRETVYDRLPYFFTDQYDVGMEYVGYATPDDYDRVIFRGQPGDHEFLAFWMAGNRVVAGMSVNVWDVIDSVRELIAAGRPVDPLRLGDPQVPLTNVAASA